VTVSDRSATVSWLTELRQDLLEVLPALIAARGERAGRRFIGCRDHPQSQYRDAPRASDKFFDLCDDRRLAWMM